MYTPSLSFSLSIPPSLSVCLSVCSVLKVTDDVAPGYSAEIPRPMDLASMQAKMDAYHSAEEFDADIALICDNCCKYNGRNSVLGQVCSVNIMKHEILFRNGSFRSLSSSRGRLIAARRF
jgi:hypothetical protein